MRIDTMRPVLARHGWEELGDRLHSMSRSGDWDAMAALVPDDVLDTFVVVGTPAEAAIRIGDRFGSLFDRISPVTPEGTDPVLLGELATAVRSRREATVG